MTSFKALLIASVLSMQAYAADAKSTPVTLNCYMLSEGTASSTVASTPVECETGGFPYPVPEGKKFCITHIYLANKYPFNPLRYGGEDMRSMYFEMNGVSVTAHHPEVTFRPSFQYQGGPLLRAWISNGMVEAQYIYGIVQGFLIPETGMCR